MSEVRLVGISKSYAPGARPALSRLDLEIGSGELVVLVGPSGCGKSTTLRIVAGLEEATTGEVYIGDRDVTRVPPAQRDIAMVFQSYALYPHMSVFDNMAFALKLRKTPAREIKERVDRAAESLGISELLARKPKQLSGGQRQRVAIGRAVVRDPKVFLFDEPLSNLDAKLRGEMRREIARIHQRTGVTSVYVTHDQIEAMTLADRIVVLNKGELQQVGTPIEIYDTPANRFVAGFFGTPAMNFLDATLTGETARGPGFDVALPAQVSPGGANLVLGIRPEALSLTERTGAAELRAQVELREVLGAEVLLHLSCGAGALTVRADARAAAREGENLSVWLPPAELHVFDGTTEQRL
jgi:ABC-type sugar transport system ATPase subunit